MMEFNKKVIFIIKRCFFLISIISMVSCQGSLFSYQGWTVDPDKRIDLLEGGPHEGTWQTFDLTINYQYEKKADILKLSGVTELSHHYKYNYEALRHFYLTLFFLDNEDKVQESKLILNDSASGLDDQVSFKKSLEIPLGAVSMAFHYELEVQEGRRRWRY